MSIVKILESAKINLLNADKKNEIISDVKLLLDSDSSEDLRIANALGKNHSLAIAQNKIGMQIELKELDEKYAGNVFKIEDIKSLCIRYHMRFLKTTHFSGHLDITAIHKIKEFAKETGTEITDGNLQHNFYMLAPNESFKLKSERMPRKSDDPAIFYKIDEKHYRLIHKWGIDFTLLRLWKGLMFRSLRIRYWLVALLFIIAISTPLLLIGISYWWALFSALGFVGSWLYNYDYFDMNSPEQCFSPYKWNQTNNSY